MYNRATVLFLCLNLTALTAQETIARVTKMRGEVKIKGLTSASFLPAKPGAAISSGDILNVGAESFCMVIYLDDKSVLKIREDTQFQFMDTENTRTVDIEFGKILSDVKQEKKKDFRVETPVSVASVKGTQFWSVINRMGFDKFYGLEGVLDVFNSVSGQSVTLGPGEMTLSTGTGQVLTTPADPEEVPEDPEVEMDQEVEPEPEQEPEEIPEEPQESEEPQETPEQVEPEAEELFKDESPEEYIFEEETPNDTAETPEETEGLPDVPTPPGKPFNLGLGVGSATIDGTIYNQLALRPEFKLGNLGIGLDLVLYVDNQGNIRKDEWDEGSDFIDKFLYVRWGEKSDPVWFKVGSLEAVTLGYGGLLSGYSNMMEFPSVRRVGLNTGVNFGNFGTEVFMANVKDFGRGGTLLGLRGTFTVSEDFPITIGVNYITDMNQFSGLKDADDDSYPDIFDDFPDSTNLWNDTDRDGIPDPHAELDSSRWDIDADGDNIYDLLDDSLSLKPIPFSIKENKSVANGFSVDIGYPIASGNSFSLMVYSEFNRLSFPGVETDQFFRPARSGTGITVPGLRASLFGFIKLSVEYRLKNDYFLPQFFDQAYDLNRILPVYSDTGTVVFTKDMLVFADTTTAINSKGYFGSMGFNLLSLATFNASYANMVADTTKFRSFHATLLVNTENIPKLSVAQAYYQRNNDENPFDFENPSVNTVLGYRLGYEVAQGVSVVWDYRQFYRDIGTGLKPVKQTTIETVFDF
ncbi:MAG: hypothetical protein CMG71_06370 [Candidatus Marinimicrobia bacterium]|nr:hypothetical protein [Candidatus Neomarinimicrobiota bacterium]|tara:strand:- start:1363 stop:3612 length:2250 start_codon:yes stop_codon:yes gene_type:complete